MRGSLVGSGLRAAMHVKKLPRVKPTYYASRTFASRSVSVREALNEALDEELARDSRVFLMGEEVAQYDGPYKISKGLHAKYGPGRIWDTPISEYGFTGICVGASMAGLVPIVEFMTMNFAMQAIDHIVNSAAKSRYMSGGKISCPITFRGPNGPPGSVAAQHSQCFASWYSNIPGLKVIAPYDAEDYKGLFKAAVRDPDPVVVLESEVLYNMKFDLPTEAQSPDFVLPIGKAKVQRSGSDVTIISFSKLLSEALIAAEMLAKDGISAEVINLRTIRPLDIETIVESVKKTHRVVTAEEGYYQSGVGAEIAASILEYGGFDYLDAPVERIAVADVPTPYSKIIEDMALPKAQNIVNAAKRVLYK